MSSGVELELRSRCMTFWECPFMTYIVPLTPSCMLSGMNSNDLVPLYSYDLTYVPFVV